MSFISSKNELISLKVKILSCTSRQDILCHDDEGGLMWTMIGDSHGHQVPSSDWESTDRFCFQDNYHPEYPTLLTADLQGQPLTKKMRIECNCFLFKL